MPLPLTLLPPTNNYSPRVSAAIDYMLQHYASILSVKEVASGVDCKYNTLRNLFDRETGMTMKRYLNHLRIEKSCEMLRETSMQVKVISGMVGYDYVSHFSSMFFKVVGVQPSVYRLSFRVSQW